MMAKQIRNDRTCIDRTDGTSYVSVCRQNMKSYSNTCMLSELEIQYRQAVRLSLVCDHLESKLK
jgi:hypothetical protein